MKPEDGWREVIAPGAFDRVDGEVPVSFNWGPRIGTARVRGTAEGLAVSMQFPSRPHAPDPAAGFAWRLGKGVQMPDPPERFPGREFTDPFLTWLGGQDAGPAEGVPWTVYAQNLARAAWDAAHLAAPRAVLLALRPGDYLVLTYPGPVSAKLVHDMKDQLRMLTGLSPARVLVFDQGAEVSVLREEAEEVPGRGEDLPGAGLRD